MQPKYSIKLFYGRVSLRFLKTVRSPNGINNYDVYIAVDGSFWGEVDSLGRFTRRIFARDGVNSWYWQACKPLLDEAIKPDPSVSPHART